MAPGNAGTAHLARNVPITASDIEGLLDFAREARIDFTVVGPEAPLASGIVDRFQQAGHLIFGPTRDAALIESSKSFAKELMVLHGVPTATAETFTSYSTAVEYIQSARLPMVVKADGLAAGKGVAVAQTRAQALEAVRLQMEEKQFGSAGERVLVEEYLEGEELSVFAFVDGDYVSPMVAARDYKRVGEGDVGPNTGGMGSYSPPAAWTAELDRRVRVEIMEPVARAMADRGTPYQGVLYAGLMLTPEGPRVLEFNCRLGDPEAQVVLPRLKADLLGVMMRTAQGTLDGACLEWDARACVGVVMASGGYPGDYATGYPIHGLDELEDVIVFHAGTKATGDEGAESAKVITDGGRVLTVAAAAETLDEARRKAYRGVERLRFKGSYHRKDIARLG